MQGGLPAPGELISIRQHRWRVERAHRSGDIVRIDVADDDRRLTFLAPIDRPSTIEPRSRWQRASRSRAFARLAGLFSHATSARIPAAAIDADVLLLPYQLEPTIALINGVRRILIADDVGLGKTIQAGLAIAELRRRRGGLRALVLAPASLRRQWANELRSRFAITATMADVRTPTVALCHGGM